MTSADQRFRVLFVGGTTYDLPLSPSLTKKWDSLEQRMELRVVGRLGTADATDPRFRLVALGSGLWAAPTRLRLARAVLSEARRFQPEVVIAQSPYEALLILPVLRALGSPPRLVVEVHGDWRTAARAYGSKRRRLYAGLADRAAGFALRRATATRAISPFTASLAEQATGRSPLAVFPAYSDLEAFTDPPLQPLPERPTVAWVGALQRVKDPHALAQAWRLIAERLPESSLVMVGDGPLRPVADRLASDFPSRVRRLPKLPPADVARVLDEATVLALPSRSEGLGRIVIEAFCRGRPVVGFATGGIPDIVVPERNGLLVPPGDVEQFADALLRLLSDRSLTERLAKGAAADAARYDWSPDRYASAVHELVKRTMRLP